MTSLIITHSTADAQKNEPRLQPVLDALHGHHSTYAIANAYDFPALFGAENAPNPAIFMASQRLGEMDVERISCFEMRLSGCDIGSNAGCYVTWGDDEVCFAVPMREFAEILDEYRSAKQVLIAWVTDTAVVTDALDIDEAFREDIMECAVRVRQSEFAPDATDTVRKNEPIQSLLTDVEQRVAGSNGLSVDMLKRVVPIYTNPVRYDIASETWPTSELRLLIPYIHETLEILDETTERETMDNEICATSVRDDYLLIRLPQQFAPAIAEMATQMPYIHNRATLDLERLVPTVSWDVELDDGHTYSIALPLDSFMHAAQSIGAWKDNLMSVRTAIIAGDSAVTGGIIVEEEGLDCAQGTGMCAQSRQMYTDEELREAAAITKAAGSATPWYNKIWRDEDGIFQVELPVIHMNTRPLPEVR